MLWAHSPLRMAGRVGRADKSKEAATALATVSTSPEQNVFFWHRLLSLIPFCVATNSLGNWPGQMSSR